MFFCGKLLRKIRVYVRSFAALQWRPSMPASPPSRRPLTRRMPSSSPRTMPRSRSVAPFCFLSPSPLRVPFESVLRPKWARPRTMGSLELPPLLLVYLALLARHFHLPPLVVHPDHIQPAVQASTRWYCVLLIWPHPSIAFHSPIILLHHIPPPTPPRTHPGDLPRALPPRHLRPPRHPRRQRPQGMERQTDVHNVEPVSLRRRRGLLTETGG